MDIPPHKFTLLSANCQGLRTYEKRNDVLSYFKDTNASIVCLQDTHLLESDISSVKNIWPECYLNGVKSNSRGVIILVNNNFEHEVLDISKDEEGNMLQLLIDCGTFKLNLINIYAPNKDDPNFFIKLKQLSQNDKANYVMICGDYNLTLDPTVDCYNYVKVNNPQSRSKVIEMMNDLDLTDSFRNLNPTLKRFSWRKKNPIKQARLDYILTSSSMIDIIDSCAIKSSYRSDHSPVEITISLDSFIRGRGTWKFNNSLLKNKDYLNLINQIIDEEKEKYCVPIYNPTYIKENFNDIFFTIDADLFLEILFLRIRGETIKFASFLKKTQRNQEKNLLQDIAHLENTPQGQFNLTLLEDKKSELENLRKEKIKGQMTRARLQWLNEGEKPTSFFCKLENRNYTEKTMRKLQTDSGSIITNQKSILKEIHKFYSNLFKSRDDQTQNDMAREKISGANLKQVREGQLGNKLSVNELSKVLREMKNNKSPGIDGISAEFLKVFWGKLKFFVTNAINCCYSKGILSTSMRQTVITCLPKGNKDRKLVKNWRPISLLTVVYKLVSSAIAKRLKPLLNDIISEPQSGFISGRSIGDCTRLIYNLMSYTKKHNIPGLLMLIDFEKAFDSVSWNFLYNVLEAFGFDENFINWIKLFNNDIKAYITQCGILSQPIPIERGCRQGDPIAPYLFLLVVEVLSCLIVQSSDICGITIGKTTFKLTQFADDTTLILDGSATSLQSAMNILEIFGELSGLKVNCEKTKLIWIGSEVASQRMLKVSHKLDWGDIQFNLLGIQFSCDLTKLPNLNYQTALQKAKKLINSWQYRYLTPFGKITVIKTLILPKFTHLFMSIPTPLEILNTLHKLLFNYIWDGKPDKVSRDKLCTTIINGGLKMVNIFQFEKSLKINWLKGFFRQDSKPWLKLVLKDINISKFTSLGSQWCLSALSKLNPFWKIVFSYYNSLCLNTKIKTNYDIMCSSIWLNKPVGTEKLYLSDWFSNGVHVIGDIINPDGSIISIEEIKHQYGFSPNFLNYITIRTLVKKFIDKTGNGTIYNFPRPHIPVYLRPLLKSCGSRTIYQVFQQNHNISSQNEIKWNSDLNMEPDEISWGIRYRICFHSIEDNSLKWLQYRILHRILGVRDLLFQNKGF